MFWCNVHIFTNSKTKHTIGTPSNMEHSDISQGLLPLSRGVAATAQHHAQVQSHTAGVPHP